MRRFQIELPEPVFSLLVQVADEERRRPKEQAAFLIESALLAQGRSPRRPAAPDRESAEDGE